MERDFLTEYINLAIEASRNDFHDNYDAWRFGPNDSMGKTGSRPLNRLHSFLLRTLHLTNEFEAKAAANKAVAHIAPYVTELGWLYEHLEDSESRKLLVQVQLYRALGARCVKLPLNSKSYWSKRETVEKLTRGAESVDLGFMGWTAHRMLLDSLGYPLELFLRPSGIVQQLLLQQYCCQADGVEVGVAEGDVVIDGGGCYGETALYFALKAGSTGKVFSFEFMPENLSIFHRNMTLNPDVAKRVTLVEKPLWDHSGEKLYIEGNGPGARVRDNATNPNARKIETISIDDLVRDKGLDKIDFIKMDIEGAEPKALKGAEGSIQKFHPKMAISVYHEPDHFFAIPQYIAGLGLGYRFALRHFTIHQEETILFAF